MSVLIETSEGDIVIDLFVEDCPKTCSNFLKLCKCKYYNGVLWHNIQRNHVLQTGDPTGTGKGGESCWALIAKSQGESSTVVESLRFFSNEIRPHLKHQKLGTVSMVGIGKEHKSASQFFITSANDLTSLDGNHTVFGRVAEGIEIIKKINDVSTDTSGRPLQNIRINHTIILDDPTEDIPGLPIPDSSPLRLQGGEDRLESNEPLDDETEINEEKEEKIKEAEARSRAQVLEMVQDIPFAEIKPADNILFVCKLNPVTSEEDLELIFSRFGKVLSVEVIRDYQTGQSLCYAFIEFEQCENAQEAYTK